MLLWLLWLLWLLALLALLALLVLLALLPIGLLAGLLRRPEGSAGLFPCGGLLSDWVPRADLLAGRQLQSA